MKRRRTDGSEEYLTGGGDENKNNKCREADYFPSYGDISVHMTMLRDKPRVDAYLGAIMQAKKEIENKIVIDVGAGTGVLSMLCAMHAGAKHVYAIEACDKMAQIATQLIKDNKLEDKVTVIHSTAEKAEIPVKADVLVSEWMGFYLVHEGTCFKICLFSIFVVNFYHLLFDSSTIPSHP